MSATVVLGSQFGDEGKGKLVDVLLASGQFKLVARCAGGHNAGHSLVVNGVNFDFHILPSGLVAPGAINLIGNGCVVHVPQFFKELRNLQEKGIKSDGRIFISDRAHLLFELHKRVDGLRETALGALKVGTTGNGIGPCYSTKASRSGIRVSELSHKAAFDTRLRAMAQSYKNEFGDLLEYDVDREIKDFDQYREELRPFIVDSVDTIVRTQDAGQDMLIEAANAICLDIDGGTYPYVTSSNTGIAGVFSGLLGIRPESLSSRIGVVKAYSTRVGSGPLPTEDFDEAGTALQELGHEFGTTTGRRRRCGHMDLVLLRHSHAINRYTVLNLTKLDVLDTFKTIKVAVAYRCRTPKPSEIPAASTSRNVGTNGTTEEIATSLWRDRLPADLRLLEPENCDVQYVELPGWESDITACRSWNDLPHRAREYIEYIETAVGVPIKWVGVGPAREAMVEKPAI